MSTVLEIPFSLGEHVYIINEIWNRTTKKYEWNILEGVVESVHIGRKLKWHKYVSDSYIKCRSTLVNALFNPIPLEKANKYVFTDICEAEAKIKYFQKLQEDDLYE